MAKLKDRGHTLIAAVDEDIRESLQSSSLSELMTTLKGGAETSLNTT